MSSPIAFSRPVTLSVESLLAGVLLIIACSTAQSDPGLLTCADGTRLTESRLVDEPLLMQSCVDEEGRAQGPARYIRASDRSIEREETYRDGKRHGEARWYFPDGQLLAEGMYNSGHRLRASFTIDALRRIAEERNDLARANNWNWRLSVADKRTLRYRVSIGSPWHRFPWSFIAPFHKLNVDAAMCDIFQREFSEVEVLLVSYVDEKEQVLGGESITTVECRKAGHL